MAAAVRRRGLKFRPHLKTGKCLEVAELSFVDGHRAGMVATLEETAYFIDAGISDLIYGMGLTPEKIERLAHLNSLAQAEGGRLALLLDAPETARALVARAEGLGANFEVFLEVDCGQGRGGREPADPALLETAAIISSSESTLLRGVLTHGGQSYGSRDLSQLKTIAHQEQERALSAAEVIRGAGIVCPEVSVGSTPTALFGEAMEGVTELRAGVHVFFDLFQMALGVCRKEELALSVLTRVVARRPERSALWVDAGALSLSQDMSTAGRLPGPPSYGGVRNLSLRPFDGEPRIRQVHQEHGEIVWKHSDKVLADLPIGGALRILPNHACMTAAFFDSYLVMRDGRPWARWSKLGAPRLPVIDRLR